MDDSDFCSILNVTDDSLEENEVDQLRTILLITAPLGLSLISQGVLLAVSLCRSGQASRLLIFHEVFLLTTWILVASLRELNRRLGFFIRPQGELEAEILCKGLGFGQVATQMLAVCGVVMMGGLR